MLGTRFQKKYGKQGHMDSLLPMATANIKEMAFRVRLAGLGTSLGNLRGTALGKVPPKSFFTSFQRWKSRSLGIRFSKKQLFPEEMGSHL